MNCQEKMKRLFMVCALLVILPAAIDAQDETRWAWAADTDPVTRRVYYDAGIAGSGGTLYLRCHEGQRRIQVLFSPIGYLGMGGQGERIPVTIRIDSRPSRQSEWVAELFGIGTSGDTDWRDLLRELESGQMLTLGVTLPSELQFGATFRLGNARETIARARDFCRVS